MSAPSVGGAGPGADRDSRSRRLPHRTAPVRPRIELGPGRRDDRRFCLIDEHDRMVNGKKLGELQTVVPTPTPSRLLRLEFPDGPVRGRGRPASRWNSLLLRTRAARPLDGPWSEALSSPRPAPAAGRRPRSGVDRGREGAASRRSRAPRWRAWLRRPARVGRRPAVPDADRGRRRRRPRRGRLGRPPGPGRVRAVVASTATSAAAWSRAATRRAARSTCRRSICCGAYRREVGRTEPLPFGIYGEVLEPGAVGVGDRSRSLDG